MADPRTHLLLAANYIAFRGLSKFARKRGDGSLCISAAITLAVTGSVEGPDTPATEEMALVIDFLKLPPDPHFPASPGWTLANWNNAPDRTAKEVIAALRGAAAQGVES